VYAELWPRRRVAPGVARALPPDFQSLIPPRVCVLQTPEALSTHTAQRKYLASGALAIAVRVPYNPCPWCAGLDIAHQEELWYTTLAHFDSKWEPSPSSA